MDIDRFVFELTHHAGVAGFGMLFGCVSTWIFARWRRRRERQNVLKGHAHGTIVVQHHLVESSVGTDGRERVPLALRIRSLGQAELKDVVPNGHLASELLNRVEHVNPHNTLISMHDADGSFLLETLTNFVGDRVGAGLHEHDSYVMAPCCEPAEMAHHQPITVIVIAKTDLARFESWDNCKGIKVEHGSDGARVLTLMEMAKRFRAEQDQLDSLRKAGKSAKFVETMYVLDLALDKRFAAIPVKAVPWERFANLLGRLKLTA